MKRFHLVFASIACCFASASMATATPANYNLLTTPSSSTGVSTTGFNSSVSSAYCINGASGCAAGGGTDYGNTATWSTNASGGNTQVTLSAWGTQTLSTSAHIQKGWLGFYGGNGFGITSQSSGELNASNAPDATSPTYQHAIDNTNAYESLVLSFATAVTLNSLQINFKATNADATILEYKGTGDPTTALTTESYSSLLCATASSSNCWNLVTNLLGMSTGTAGNLITGGTASQYWMVGAYLPIGKNGAYNGVNDAFKVSGFTATRASVPEPGSIALFGIAGAAFVASRRRRARNA